MTEKPFVHKKAFNSILQIFYFMMKLQNYFKLLNKTFK